MKDYSVEAEKRAAWIRKVIEDAGAKGVIFGNSGGKDSALVGVLCKMAAKQAAPPFDVLGVIMPCGSTSNYGSDLEHARLVAEAFGIDSAVVDLTPCKNIFLDKLSNSGDISSLASSNMNPRLRMTALYALAQSNGYLVAGTGNKSEYYTGYFTKWGDGAYDFNPIADLLATEVFEFLRHLRVPGEIIGKPPSAGLFEGQTDEAEMGVSYAAIDSYLQTGEGEPSDIDKIHLLHSRTAHKRRLPKTFGSEEF